MIVFLTNALRLKIIRWVDKKKIRSSESLPSSVTWSTQCGQRLAILSIPCLIRSLFPNVGLGGEPCLVDLGGVPYLVPTVQRDRTYDLADLPGLMNVKDGTILMIGAGAGPWQHLNTNCEMMTNLSLTLEEGKSNIVNGTRLATVDPAGQRMLHVVPPEQTRCSLLNNLLISRGQPSTPVLRIRCQKRTGPNNFVTCMRNTVAQHYGDKPVG